MVYTRHMRTSVTVLAVSVVVGVATTAAGPAFADDLGEVATSTFSYSSVDTTSGIIVGGVPGYLTPPTMAGRQKRLASLAVLGSSARSIPSSLSAISFLPGMNQPLSRRARPPA